MLGNRRLRQIGSLYVSMILVILSGYRTPEQAAELARTFGCVRLVYNMALQARTEAWLVGHPTVLWFVREAEGTT